MPTSKILGGSFEPLEPPHPTGLKSGDLPLHQRCFQTKKDHCRTKKCGVLFATALIHQTGVLLLLILRQRRTFSDRKDDVLVVLGVVTSVKIVQLDVIVVAGNIIYLCAACRNNRCSLDKPAAPHRKKL